jgi:hypothetical protein
MVFWLLLVWCVCYAVAVAVAVGTPWMTVASLLVVAVLVGCWVVWCFGGEPVSPGVRVEGLESRVLRSALVARRGNFRSVVGAASPGDIVSFASGSYQLRDTLVLPAGVSYVGHGVTLAASSALLSSGMPAVQSSGSSLVTSVSGFEISGGLKLDGGLFAVSGDTFVRGGVVLNAIVSSSVSGNVFAGIDGVGIYGYPGDGDAFDGNEFENTAEGVHLISAAVGLDVCGNVVVGASDCGVELQGPMRDVLVSGNWVGEWAVANGHMGLSIATGGGVGITVSGNTLLQSSPLVGCGYALEITGSGVSSSGNTVVGWGTFVLDALGGVNGFNGDAIYGGSVWGEDSGGPYPAPSGSDVVRPLSSYVAGAVPAGVVPGSVVVSSRSVIVGGVRFVEFGVWPSRASSSRV